MSRSDIAGSCGNSIYSFFGNLCTFLHSGYINLLSCQRCRRVLFPLHPLQHLFFVDFLVLAILQLSLSSMFHFLLLPFALCPSGSPWKVMCPRVLLLLFRTIPFPSPGNLPYPGIEPRSPALQANSLPSEPPGKPITEFKYIFHITFVIGGRRLEHELSYILLDFCCEKPGSKCLRLCRTNGISHKYSFLPLSCRSSYR